MPSLLEAGCAGSMTVQASDLINACCKWVLPCKCSSRFTFSLHAIKFAICGTECFAIGGSAQAPGICTKHHCCVWANNAQDRYARHNCLPANHHVRHHKGMATPVWNCCLAPDHMVHMAKHGSRIAWQNTDHLVAKQRCGAEKFLLGRSMKLGCGT